MKCLKMKTGVHNAKASPSTIRFSNALPIPERAYSESEREKFKLLRWDSVGRHGRSGRYKRLFYYGKWGKGSSRRAHRSVVGYRNFHSRFGLMISNADPSKWMAKTSLPGCGAHNSFSHMHRSHEDRHFQWFFLKNQGGINPYAICKLMYGARTIKSSAPFLNAKENGNSSFRIVSNGRDEKTRQSFSKPQTVIPDAGAILIFPTTHKPMSDPKTKNPDSKQGRERKQNHPSVFWPVPKKKSSTPEYDPAARSATGAGSIPVSFSFTSAGITARNISISSHEPVIRDLPMGSFGSMQKPGASTRIQGIQTDRGAVSSKSRDVETNKTQNTGHTTQNTGHLKPHTGNPKPDTPLGHIPSAPRKVMHQKLASEAAVPE